MIERSADRLHFKPVASVGPGTQVQSRYGHNRDGRINSQDVAPARNHQGSALPLITPPAAAAAAPPPPRMILGATVDTAASPATPVADGKAKWVKTAARAVLVQGGDIE